MKNLNNFPLIWCDEWVAKNGFGWKWVDCVGKWCCEGEVKLDMLEENIVPEKSATPFYSFVF